MLIRLNASSAVPLEDITPLMLPDPLKDFPHIDLAVANLVAVLALPINDPLKLDAVIFESLP